MTTIIGSLSFDVAVGTLVSLPVKLQQIQPHLRGATSVDIKQFGSKLLGHR